MPVGGSGFVSWRRGRKPPRWIPSSRGRAPVAGDAWTTRRSVPPPTAGQHLESAGLVRALDDFDRELCPQRPHPVGKEIPGISAVHPDKTQPGTPDQDAGQERLGTLPFRRAARGDVDGRQQPMVSTRMWRLRPLICLAASWPTLPPCESDLTLWLSRTAAVGRERLPAFSRTRARRQALMFSQTCSRTRLRKMWWTVWYGGKSTGSMCQGLPAFTT